MQARIGAAVGVLLVSALSISAVEASPATGFAAARTSAGVSITAPTGASLLYRASWKKGLQASKWKVPGGFTVARGMLTYDGSDDVGAFAPFQTNGLKNFAVEATIQVGAATRPDSAAFDIFVHRHFNSTNKDDRSGIFAGYDAVGGDSSAKHVADLFWRGAVDNYVPGSTYALDANFHRYRLEARGTAYRQLIDGRVMVPWTVIKDSRRFSRVGLTFTYFPARVKAFTVFALGPAGVKPILDTSGLVSRSIGAADAAVPPLTGVFRDNALYSADTSIDLTTLRRTGRVYGYLEKYSDDKTYISESLNLHAGPGGAKMIYGLFVAAVHAAEHTAQGYKETDTSVRHRRGELRVYLSVRSPGQAFVCDRSAVSSREVLRCDPRRFGDAGRGRAGASARPDRR